MIAPKQQRHATATGIALSAAVIATVVLLIIGSDRPTAALTAFFLGPFSNPYYFGNMLAEAGLLVLTGLGVCLAFRAGVFNLGGEGQTYAAATASAAVVLVMPAAPGGVGIAAAFLVGIAIGGTLGAFSGVFKWLTDTDELITSFLISAAAIPIVDYLIIGPWNDPASNLLTTRRVAEQFRLLRILPPSYLHVGVFGAIALSVFMLFYLFRTVSGYELRLCGLNRDFARYGGVPVGMYIVGPMAASGAFHGLAGTTAVLGIHHAALVGFTGGLGWNGIAVALIARTHPLGVIPAALVFAYLNAGAKAAMLHTTFTFELGTIIQAVIFFLITATNIGPQLLGPRLTGAILTRRTRRSKQSEATNDL